MPATRRSAACRRRRRPRSASSIVSFGDRSCARNSSTRALVRVGAQPPVERMVPVLAEQRQPQLDDGVAGRRARARRTASEAIASRTCRRRTDPDSDAGAAPGSARPYCPPSEREIFLRATSASSTSSHAATDMRRVVLRREADVMHDAQQVRARSRIP